MRKSFKKVLDEVIFDLIANRNAEDEDIGMALNAVLRDMERQKATTNLLRFLIKLERNRFTKFNS